MGSPFGGISPIAPSKEQKRSTVSFSSGPRLNFSRGGNKGVRASRGRESYDASGVGDTLIGTAQDIGDSFEEDLAALKAEYDRAIASSGGGGDYGVGEALEYLRDVQGNRAAIQEVYDEYGEFIDPIAQEAIDIALGMVAEGAPKLDAIHTEAVAGINEAYESAESLALAEAELIDAGEAAAESAAASTGYFKDLLLGNETENAEIARKLLGLQSTAYEKQAIAEKELDEGSMERQAHLTDIAFGQMEEQAQAALAAARRAAAAAAARRRALVAERNAAIAELNKEKYDAMQLNPHEAGEVAAVENMRSTAAHLPYQRQQLIFNTVSNAVSEQVPASRSSLYIRDKGIAMSQAEKKIVRQSLEAYTAGSRYQQNRDNERTRFEAGMGYR